MSSPQCRVCQRSTELGVTVDTSKSNKAWGRELGVDEASVRRHHKHAPKLDPAVGGGRCDLGPDGGEFFDIKTDKPIEDWSTIFAQFKLNPTHFAIVDDTVRISMWQQSKRLENGDRDTATLYSYRASFVRLMAGAVDVAEITKSLRAWKPVKPISTRPLGEPVTFFVGWADWQLGKGEGDGTPGTVQRVLDGFDRSVQRIQDLRRQGINVASLVIANMGDHTEAVTGHYTSQTYSVDLNQRDQLNAAVELNMAGIKVHAPLFEDVEYAACLCNHGQWQRLGGKQITDDSDNSTGFIGDVLGTICGLHPSLEHVRFNIPRDEMITTGIYSGVPVAMAHGHKIGGAEETWLSKQSGWLRSERDFNVGLWVTAHRHTASLDDFGPYSRIQCTTNDPGSKSFTDQTGKFSTQGTTTFLIGRHDRRRFSHYEVL